MHISSLLCVAVSPINACCHLWYISAFPPAPTTRCTHGWSTPPVEPKGAKGCVRDREHRVIPSCSTSELYLIYLRAVLLQPTATYSLVRPPRLSNIPAGRVGRALPNRYLSFRPRTSLYVGQREESFKGLLCTSFCMPCLIVKINARLITACTSPNNTHETSAAKCRRQKMSLLFARGRTWVTYLCTSIDNPIEISKEFHGNPRGTAEVYGAPWSSTDVPTELTSSRSSVEFLGVPLNSTRVVYGIPRKWSLFNSFRRKPWSSVDFHGCGESRQSPRWKIHGLVTIFGGGGLEKIIG